MMNISFFSKWVAFRFNKCYLIYYCQRLSLRFNLTPDEVLELDPMRVSLSHYLNHPIRFMRKIVGIVFGDLISSLDVPQSIWYKLFVVFRSRVNNLTVGCEWVIHILRSVSICHKNIWIANEYTTMQDLFDIFRMILSNSFKFLSRVNRIVSYCDTFHSKWVLTLIDPVNSALRDVLGCIESLSRNGTFLHFNRIKVWHQLY